jgi:PAS domain S-box-containing protein
MANDNRDEIRNILLKPLPFRASLWVITIFWTLAVAIVLVCEIADEYKHAGHLLLANQVDIKKSEADIHELKRIGIRDRLLGYGSMWLLGIVGIAIYSHRMKEQMRRRSEAEERLREANEGLERRVADRTAELADANNRLEDEIAERRKAEQWLLESESRFRGYFEQGLVGMAMLSDKMTWIEVNERLCRMLGYTEDELVLQSWVTLTSPDDWPAEKTQFDSLLSGKAGTITLEKHFIRKSKELLPVSISAQCLRNPDGAFDSLLVLVQEKRT